MPTRTILLLAFLSGLIHAEPSYGVEHLTLSRGGQVIHVSGRVEVEAEDGGLLLLAPNGLLWVAQPEELTERRADEVPFCWLGRKELARSLLDELPAGFFVHDTAHYLICYNTSTAYARWCGALYERLYQGFHNFWTRNGLTLTEPPAPLVALLFDRKSASPTTRAKTWAQQRTPSSGITVSVRIG